MRRRAPRPTVILDPNEVNTAGRERRAVEGGTTDGRWRTSKIENMQSCLIATHSKNIANFHEEQRSVTGFLQNTPLPYALEPVASFKQKKYRVAALK